MGVELSETRAELAEEKAKLPLLFSIVAVNGVSVAGLLLAYWQGWTAL